MAATVMPVTVAERETLEGRIVAAAAPETGRCEEEDQPDYKRDGNQQGDEPPDEAECHHGSSSHSPAHRGPAPHGEPAI
jgi:hypothetical protein